MMTQEQTLEIHGWKVYAGVDEDGHLAIHVSNQDGSQVHDLAADIANGHEWAERFTTSAIEAAHNERTREEV